MWIIWIIAVFLIVSLINAIVNLPPKCPKCGKRKNKKISSEVIGVEDIVIKKTETIKHYSKEQTVWGEPRFDQWHKPESVSIRHYTVPGERIFYVDTYSCQNCGWTFLVEEYMDKEK